MGRGYRGIIKNQGDLLLAYPNSEPRQDHTYRRKQQHPFHIYFPFAALDFGFDRLGRCFGARICGAGFILSIRFKTSSRSNPLSALLIVKTECPAFSWAKSGGTAPVSLALRRHPPNHWPVSRVQPIRSVAGSRSSAKSTRLLPLAIPT